MEGGWRDDVLRIEGPAVHELERRFLATWRMAFRGALGRLRTRLHQARQLRRLGPRRGNVCLSVLSSRRSIHRAYLHAIARARSSVLIAAAYFVPARAPLPFVALGAAIGLVLGAPVTLLLRVLPTRHGRRLVRVLRSRPVVAVRS